MVRTNTCSHDKKKGEIGLRVLKLIYALYKMSLFTPHGLYRFISAIHQYGMNVMVLLKLAERFGNKIALVDDHEKLDFKQLFTQSDKLSIHLSMKYQLKSGQKVGLLSKNHVSMVKSIFAVSRLGLDIYLLNTEMSKSQLQPLFEKHDFDLLIYDFELNSIIEQSGFHKEKILSYHENLPAINNLSTTDVNEKSNLKRTSAGKIMLLTGGTTGKSKEVAHKPSIYHYINPFLSLLTRLNLLNYKTVYIATPIYHGYGIAVLFLFIVLGKKVVISNRFDAEKACRLIQAHHVEVITVVPLMIHKMLKVNPDDLKSLACIASGGAELNPRLTAEVHRSLGDVMYNLYGTSESGLNIIATPQDLQYSAKTIGRLIDGVRLKVLDHNQAEVEAGEIGQFCIQASRSMKNRDSSWIKTGDLGYQDQQGYYFLCGRTDDMIVSGGENVYPIELEQVLIQHPYIENVAVIGMKDEDFGQRLRAFVQPTENTHLTEEELYHWLRPRVARFHIPKHITFIEEMPYTSLGKLDKKQLKSRVF